MSESPEPIKTDVDDAAIVSAALEMAAAFHRTLGPSCWASCCRAMSGIVVPRMCVTIALEPTIKVREVLLVAGFRALKRQLDGC